MSDMFLFNIFNDFIGGIKHVFNVFFEIYVVLTFFMRSFMRSRLLSFE